MKLEIVKFTITGRMPILEDGFGKPQISYFVKATDDKDSEVVSECFSTQEQAEVYFAGLKEHHSVHGTYGPVKEVIKSENI